MDIAALLGDEADSLPAHTCTIADRQGLSLPGPGHLDPVMIDSHRPTPVLRNLAHLYGHGRLAGTGYLSILPVDQRAGTRSQPARSPAGATDRSREEAAMTNPEPAGWDRPGDDGVLDDDDTLASDDMTRDRLDAGIDPPEQYSVAEGWGNTGSEARRGESLEQRLAEEEPEQGLRLPIAGAADPEAGQLVADGSPGASSGTATQLPAGLPDDERDAEQGAIHVGNTPSP